MNVKKTPSNKAFVSKTGKDEIHLENIENIESKNITNNGGLITSPAIKQASSISSPSSVSLKEFIENVFPDDEIKKQDKFANLLTISLLAVKSGIDNFGTLYASLSETAKDKILKNYRIKTAILKEVRKSANIGSYLSEMVNRKSAFIDVNDLISLQKNTKLNTQDSKTINDLIASLSSNTPRITACYDFLKAYEQSALTNTPLTPQQLSEFSLNISNKTVDKKKVVKKLVIGKIRRTTTSLRKTEEQKIFEKVFATIITTVAQNMTSQFSLVLETFDITFDRLLQKLKTYNPQTQQIVLDNFFTKLDIQSHYNGLSAKDKVLFLSNICQCITNMQRKSGNINQTFITPIELNGTQLGAKNIIHNCIVMREQGLSAQAIKEFITIFENDYKLLNPNCTGISLLTDAREKVKSLPKNKLQQYEQLVCEIEKLQLEQSISSAPLSVTAKKFKI